MDDQPTPRGSTGSGALPRIAVVNDYEIVIAGLTRMLEPFADRVTIVDAILIDEPIEGGPVDVALYDTFGRAGLEGPKLGQLLDKPEVNRAAVYSFDFDDVAVRNAFDAGACGYLSKTMSAEQLVGHLERLAAGEIIVGAPAGSAAAARSGRDWPGRELGLSEREAEVVSLAALGRRNAQIAEMLYVSVDTVKTHLARSFRKLGVHNRTELSVTVHAHPSFRRYGEGISNGVSASSR
ncbi:MAG: LuxR family transcriptional regulator [Acidimicrobiales bacterium]|nr:LuxR family transcriptional regulator [Acidimicrobiales bacterium]